MALPVFARNPMLAAGMDQNSERSLNAKLRGTSRAVPENTPAKLMRFMRRGAVDEGCTCRIQRAPVPDRRAWAVIVAACERAPDIVLVARGNAESDDIDQQVLAFARGRGWKRS